MKSKLDLIWFTPYLIGIVGIIISSVYYLKEVAAPLVNENIWLGIFHMALVLIVLDHGLVWLFKGLGELF